MIYIFKKNNFINMKISCVYLTNKDNYKNDLIYKKLNEMCKESNIDLYIYINNENKQYEWNDNICEFNYISIKKKYNYNYYMGKNYVGCTFLMLIDLLNTKTYYDYYIFYEDDLGWFSSDNLFNKINFNYDIIFKKPIINNEWYWYDNYNNLNKDIYKSYAGLLNFYICSKEFLCKLYNFINNGNYAHFEYLIKAFAYANNYNIGYLDDMIDVELVWLTSNLSGEYHDMIHPIKTNDIFYKYKNMMN